MCIAAVKAQPTKETKAKKPKVYNLETSASYFNNFERSKKAQKKKKKYQHN